MRRRQRRCVEPRSVNDKPMLAPSAPVSSPLTIDARVRYVQAGGGLADLEYKSEQPMGWSETECECG
jgi:hypothetical protein